MTKSNIGHSVEILPETLEATLEKQPGPGKRYKLFVSVEAEVEVDWKVKLVSAHPQGTNPRVKLLRFDVELPTGKHSNAIVRKTIRYEEAPPHADYKEVTIEDGKQTVSKQVSIIV